MRRKRIRKRKKKYDAPSYLRWNRKNQDKRVALNREARRRGIYGKRRAMGKDLSHTSDGKMVLESAKSNRSRNGKNGRSTKKRSR